MKPYIKIEQFVYPVQSIMFRLYSNSIALFEMGTVDNEPLARFEGQQAERLKRWLDANAEDLTVEEELEQDSSMPGRPGLVEV